MSYEIHIPTGNGNEIHFKIDTGADVSAISVTDVEKIGLTIKDIKPTKKKLTGPANEKLKCIGYIKTKFTWGNETSEELLYVCKDLKRALLGKPAISRLKILKFEEPQTVTCGEVAYEDDDEEHEDEEHPVKRSTQQYSRGLGR